MKKKKMDRIANGFPGRILSHKGLILGFLLGILLLQGTLLQGTGYCGPVKYVGEELSFYVKRFDRITSTQESLRYEDRKAKLVRKGVNCFIYLDNELKATDAQLDSLVTKWDNTVYTRMKEIFGKGFEPGIDGYDQIFILLTEIHDTYDGETDFTRVYSYFDYNNEANTSAFTYSNTKELLVVDPVKNETGSDSFMSALASSYQKMLRWYRKVWIAKKSAKVQDLSDTRVEDIDYWVDEGLSELSGYICGFGHPSSTEFFLAFPKTTLTMTFPQYYLETNRGAAYLFLLYLYEKKGTRLINEVAVNSYIGTESIVQALKTIRSSEQFAELFFRWTIANYLDNIEVLDGIYGYTSINLGISPTIEEREFPVSNKTLTIYEQEVEYIAITSGDAGEIDFHFYGDNSNDFRIMAIKHSHLGTPQLEEISMTTNKGHAYFDRFGFDYDSVVLAITNVSSTGNGSATYSLIKRGPAISVFVNPALTDNLIINVLARDASSVSVLQQGMADEIPLPMNSQDKTYTEVEADTGNVSSASGYKMFVENSSWEINEFANGRVKILTGPGINQTREILSNYKNYLTLKEPWATPPDSTSTYMIYKQEKMETLYTGSYFIDRKYPGTAKIIVRGTGADGVTGASVYSFSVIPIFDQETANIRIDFQNIVEEQASYGSTKVAATALAVVMPRAADDITVSGGSILGEPFEINLPSGSLKAVRETGLTQASAGAKIDVYAMVDKGWQAMRATPSEESSGALSFTPLQGNWLYALIQDSAPPSLAISDQEDAQTVTMLDTLSGVDASTVTLEVDGLSRRLDLEQTDSGLVLHLPQGQGMARISVADNAGNSASTQVVLATFLAVVPGISSFKGWPVPASSWMNLEFSWAGQLQWAKISLYDVSGLLMKEFGTDDINLGNGSGTVKWDLTDDLGREVANGAYILRLRAEIGTEKYEQIRKIAVIR